MLLYYVSYQPRFVMLFLNEVALATLVAGLQLIIIEASDGSAVMRRPGADMGLGDGRQAAQARGLATVSSERGDSRYDKLCQGFAAHCGIRGSFTL